MKIIFEAETTRDLIGLVAAFSETTGDATIPAEDQAILDTLLHFERRLARRVERLDAAFPPSQEST